MPCDSIILNRVNLKAADRTLLKKALEKLGVTGLSEYKGIFSFRYGGVDYTLDEDRLSGSNRFIGALADKIKQTYSLCAVEEAADNFGWLKQDSDDPNTFVLIKD